MTGNLWPFKSSFDGPSLASVKRFMLATPFTLMWLMSQNKTRTNSRRSSGRQNKCQSPDSSPNLEEKQVVRTFRDSVHQQTDSRYDVAMPRKLRSTKLGESWSQVCQRLCSMEKSLTKHGDWPVSRDAVLDYVQQNHAEIVLPELVNVGEKDCYYLPMHTVTKHSSTTTKVRIVFDASAKTTNGESLNGILSSGPKVYSHIVRQILCFQVHPITMIANISQMFRQILLSEQYRDLHWFAFCSSPEELICDYHMKWVTFWSHKFSLPRYRNPATSS